MCTIITNITKNCGYSVAGNTTELYVANASDITLTISGTSSLVTAISGNFKRYDVSTDTLIDTDTMTIGAAQNKFFEHKVAFKIADNSNDAKLALEDFGTSRVICVVKDKNNQFKLYGSGGSKGIGLDCKVLNYNGGGASGDEFGYTVEAMESFPNTHYVLASALGVTGSGTYSFV